MTKIEDNLPQNCYPGHWVRVVYMKVVKPISEIADTINEIIILIVLKRIRYQIKFVLDC